MNLKTVRFTERTVFSRVGKPTLTYEVGSVHTLKADHADRWVNYGRAVRIADTTVPQLMESVEQMGQIVRGEREPSRVFEVKDASNGNAVDGAEAMAESDSSPASSGAVTQQPRRRGRPPRQSADNSGR